MDLVSDVEGVDASNIYIRRNCGINCAIPCGKEIEGGGGLAGINAALLSPEVVSLRGGVRGCSDFVPSIG